MKFVILTHGIVPDFGVMGPVLTPREYDLHQVLKWVAYGVDIREVMDDGNYRKLSFNDERILDEIRKELNNKVVEKKEEKREVEKIPKHRRVGIYPKEEIKQKKVEVKKVEQEEKKIEPPKEEINVNDVKVDFPIDNLEKPE